MADDIELEIAIAEQEALAKSKRQPSTTQPVAQEPSWLDTAGQYGKSLVKGVTGLAQTAEMLSPMYWTAHANGLPTSGDLLEVMRKQEVGDPKFQTPEGRVLGKAVEYLPTAALPEAGVVSTISSGVGAGIANELFPGNPWAEAVGAAAHGAIGPAFKPIAAKLAPALEAASIGGGVKQAMKSLKDRGLVEGADGTLQTRANQAVSSVVAEGKLPLMRGEVDTANVVNAEKDEIGDAIGVIVDELDRAGISPNLSFSNAKKLVATAPYSDRQRLAEQFTQYQQELSSQLSQASQRGEGLHKGLLVEKSARGAAYNKPIAQRTPADMDTRLDRAIERDLREAIDKSAATILPPDKMAAYGELNRRYGAYKTVSQIVNENAARMSATPWFRRPMDIMRTSGGLGSLGLATGGLPGYAATMAAGVALTSKAGMGMQAAALRELAKQGMNPYTMGIPLSREWDEIRDNDIAKEDIASKFGMPLAQFNELPEPQQKLAHAQVIIGNPSSAEQVPGGYTSVINGKFFDPGEQDYHMNQASNLPPKERANIIGQLYDGGKFVPLPNQEAKPELLPLKPLGDIGSLLPDLSVSQDFTSDQSSTGIIDQMRKSMGQHDATRSGL